MISVTTDTVSTVRLLQHELLSKLGCQGRHTSLTVPDADETMLSKEVPKLWVCTVDGGVFPALLGAVRLLSIWCLSVGVEQGAFGRAVGEVRKSVVSELT